MVLKLPVTTAIAAKRATAPWVTEGLKLQCRASHSSAPQDSTPSPSAASQQHIEDETIRKVPAKEGLHSLVWRDFTEVDFTEGLSEDVTTTREVPKRKKIGGKTPNGQNPKKGTLEFVKKLGHVPIRRLGSQAPRQQRAAYRLTPLDSETVTNEEFTKKWTTKMNSNHPALVRNMPGFLESQSWFQHPDAFRSGEFTTRASPVQTQPTEKKPTFTALRDSILASAIRQGGAKDNTPSAVDQLFDSLGAKFRIDRSNVSTDAWINPDRKLPLEIFQRWLFKSGRFNRHNLDHTVDRILKLAKEESDPWLSFEAPIAFMREVIQYNKETGPDNAISGVAGLIELEDRLTEDFPYPPIVREIGGLTYNANSCSIRFGIGPRRSDLRRSTETTVIGQLAGYGRALLIPPRLTSLGGKSLLSHPQVSSLRAKTGSIIRNDGRYMKNIMKATWVLGFEQTVPERINAELKPGDALLVPPGWWYGIRNTNWHNQLHATVGWYLKTDENPYKQDWERDAELEYAAEEDDAEIGDEDFASEFGRVPPTGISK